MFDRFILRSSDLYYCTYSKTVSKVRYTCALTATPIVTSSFQLSRLAHLLRPERYPNPKRLAQDLESKRFSIEQDPFFFINRKASEFGRTSNYNNPVNHQDL